MGALLLAAEWEKRWVKSTHKSDYGEFKWTAGAFYGDAEKDKGINTNTLFRSMHLLESLLALFQEFRPARMPSSMLGVPRLNRSLTRGRPWSFSSLSNMNRRLTAAEVM